MKYHYVLRANERGDICAGTMPRGWRYKDIPFGLVFCHASQERFVYCFAVPKGGRFAVSVAEFRVPNGQKNLGSASVIDAVAWIDDILNKYFGEYMTRNEDEQRKWLHETLDIAINYAEEVYSIKSGTPEFIEQNAENLRNAEECAAQAMKEIQFWIGESCMPVPKAEPTWDGPGRRRT